MLHVWDGRHMVTHTVPVGEFAGPYVFAGEGATQ